MPPRRENDFMDVDSDSDISIIDDSTRGKGKTKGKTLEKRKKNKGKGKAKDVSCVPPYHITRPSILIQQAYTWEASYTRSWDTVQEDEAGSLQGAVEEWMARGRRRRSVVSSSFVQNLTQCHHKAAGANSCYTAYHYPSSYHFTRFIGGHDRP
jgi:transcription initiation factor TFIIH subunit 2